MDKDSFDKFTMRSCIGEWLERTPCAPCDSPHAYVAMSMSLAREWTPFVNSRTYGPTSITTCAKRSSSLRSCILEPCTITPLLLCPDTILMRMRTCIHAYASKHMHLRAHASILTPICPCTHAQIRFWRSCGGMRGAGAAFWPWPMQMQP